MAKKDPYIVIPNPEVPPKPKVSNADLVIPEGAIRGGMGGWIKPGCSTGRHKSPGKIIRDKMARGIWDGLPRLIEMIQNPATPNREVIPAMEFLAKYGLGQKLEISIGNSEMLRLMVQTCVRFVDPAKWDDLRIALTEVFRAYEPHSDDLEAVVDSEGEEAGEGP